MSKVVLPGEIDATEFIHCVMQAAFLFKGSVTSWIRTELHNLAVHGPRKSKHLQGLAADLVWDVVPELTRLEAFCKDYGCRVRREYEHEPWVGPKPSRVFSYDHFSHDHIEKA